MIRSFAAGATLSCHFFLFRLSLAGFRFAIDNAFDHFFEGDSDILRFFWDFTEDERDSFMEDFDLDCFWESIKLNRCNFVFNKTKKCRSIILCGSINPVVKL